MNTYVYSLPWSWARSFGWKTPPYWTSGWSSWSGCKTVTLWFRCWIKTMGWIRDQRCRLWLWCYYCLFYHWKNVRRCWVHSCRLRWNNCLAGKIKGIEIGCCWIHFYWLRWSNGLAGKIEGTKDGWTRDGWWIPKMICLVLFDYF